MTTYLIIFVSPEMIDRHVAINDLIKRICWGTVSVMRGHKQEIVFVEVIVM